MIDDRRRTVVRSAMMIGALFTTLSGARIAAAQSWAGGRQTPTLSQIFAIDKTGEDNWLYGQEDVAGDGLDNFKQPEQSIDIRTAYAAADAASFFARVYVSDPNAVGGNITVYFFVDSDRNVSTGGGANAIEIDPKFTSDPTSGGFDYVIGVRGTQMIAGVWQWSTTQNKYATITANGATGEGGTDADPIRINSLTHGYLQAKAPLTLIGLTQACNANLYVRSVDASGGDLEVGQVGSCVPVDNNNDGTPDVLVPPVGSGCTSDAQCAGGGVCQADGTCLLPQPCTTANDCLPTQDCTADGRCVPKGGGSCSTNANCTGGLVCSAGTCRACTLGGTECGPDLVCGPTGTCVSSAGNGGLPAGDEVRGGAFKFKCAVTTGAALRDRADGEAGSSIALLALLAAVSIKRRRGRAASP